MKKEKMLLTHVITTVTLFCIVFINIGCKKSDQEEIHLNSTPVANPYEIIKYDKKICEMIELNEHKSVVPKHFQLQVKPEEIMSIILPDTPKTISMGEYKEILKKYHFFDADKNPDGCFRNYYIIHSFGGDEKVIDAITGLVWQRNRSEEVKFKKVSKIVKELNKKNFEGSDKWRLPTVEEALSLVDCKGNYDYAMHEPFIFASGSSNDSDIWTSNKLIDKKNKKKHANITVSYSFGKAKLNNQYTKNAVRVVRRATRKEIELAIDKLNIKYSEKLNNNQLTERDYCIYREALTYYEPVVRKTFLPLPEIKKRKLRSEPFKMDYYELKKNIEKENFYVSMLHVNKEGCCENDFIKGPDGTIVDDVNGLVWSRKYFKTIPKDQIEEYLNTVNDKDKQKWRLPTVEEALSLIGHVDPKYNDNNRLDPVFELPNTGSLLTCDKTEKGYGGKRSYYYILLQSHTIERISGINRTVNILLVRSDIES